MKKLIFLSTILLFSTVYALVQPSQFANYLGTGANPRLYLELGNNGPKWDSFKIDYQGIGKIPYCKNSQDDWSTWNVKDTNGNYYGTITLTENTKHDAYTASYVGGSGGYYLEDVNFSYNSSVNAYQLTVDKIHQGSGPFPTTPKATPAAYSGTDTPVILSVSNHTIINNKGKKIVLKGMVRPSLEWNPRGENLSAADITNMKKWGINVIRLDLNQNYWFGSESVDTKGSYKQTIDAIIYHAIQNDMAVILDLHWTENGHQNPMANKQSIVFWQEVAKQYKNFGTVIFELFNEPGMPQEPLTPDIWLNGNDQYAGMQQIFDAIRDTGAQNICIINGLDYGYDLSFVNKNFKVNGNNIIYGSHPYNDKGADGYSGAGGSFANNFKGIIDDYPIIFTEFGDNNGNDYNTDKYQAIYERILKYISENEISYTGFAWWVQPDNPAFPALISDWNGTPQNGGKQIYQDLHDNPVIPIDAQ